jgi:hypothetical protein
MSEWKPIESAPKDGTLILLYCPDDEPCIVVGNYYRDEEMDGEWWLYADELLTDACPEGAKPTHWMPLPPPPDREA